MGALADPVPLRRCLATGEVQPKAGLVRFVVGPQDGPVPARVVPDVDERLPGRGLWVGARRDLVGRAVKRGLFARAAGGAVQADADLPDLVAGLIARRLVERIGLARRAGAAVAGFAKVRDWLEAGRAGLVLEATDAGADAPRRIASALRGVGVVHALAGAELARAFEREFVAHVAIAAGAHAGAIGREAQRLAGFRAAAQDGGNDD